MASFLQRVFSGATLDFKGAFRANDTVKIEKNPNDPEKDVLRFGEGKDDYFEVEGTKMDKERLREILSKVVESPTMLKKIRDLPPEDRPTLIQDHGGKVNGQSCGGYCNGAVISMSVSSGTGYMAAGIFCHEFQHQYQYKKGFGLHRSDLGLSESILNDRIYESAADTAMYQYMHEMKGKNPQAANAFAMNLSISPGQRAYSAAKIKGKSEQDCMLAGMMGYAESYTTAQYYAKSYHSEVGEEDMRGLNGDLYTDNIRSAVGIRFFQNRMNGEKLDEVAAFKAHTIGMTAETCDDKKVNKALRSAEFNYVTPTVARAITRWAEKLKAAGKPMTENPDKLNVRTAYGVTKNKERGGFAGMMFKAKTKLMSVVNNLKNGKDKDSLGAIKRYHDGGFAVLALTADEQGLPAAQIGFSADGASKEFEAVKRLGQKETDKRTETAQKMFGILMKQPVFRRQVEEMHKNGVEINLSFSDAVRQPRTIQGNTILLNPNQKPQQLADQFIRQFVPVVREGIASKQAAPQQTEAEAAAPKAAEKQPEKQFAPKATELAPKAAEPKQEINGEALLKIVDQLAFRTSKSNQSDTYYKPTPVETKLIDAMAKYSKDILKSAGIDARSAQAKPFRAKCLAEWAQSPQGKSGVTKLMQAYGNMKAFEKPREKQSLMQTLKAQPHEPIDQGYSLMSALNKQQAKNNAAKAVQTAQAARSTAQR